MGIKTVLFIIFLAVALYRIFKLVEFMKFKEAVFNHEPGPCKIVKAAKQSCTNAHKDSKACDDWAQRGECQANRNWMIENCAKACNYCEDPDTPILGAEDFADLGNGKILMSTGVKYKHDPFPERKGQIFLFDFNQPDAGVQRVSMIWNNEKISNMNPHGIAVWKTAEGKVIVFLVNHDGGEVVERFEYSANINLMTHVETITHPGFTHLNSVQPTGERSFYVTNHSYFPTGLISKLESYLMLRLGNIVYFDGENLKVVSSGYLLPNGLHSSADNKFLYLANIGDMSIETFAIEEDYSLEHVHTLSINSVIDNIQVDAETGDLWLGALAVPWKNLLYLENPRNATELPPTQVLRVKTEDGIPTYKITDIYTNDGSLITFATVAMTYKNTMLAGSVYHNTVLCQIVHV